MGPSQLGKTQNKYSSHVLFHCSPFHVRRLAVTACCRHQKVASPTDWTKFWDLLFAHKKEGCHETTWNVTTKYRIRLQNNTISSSDYTKSGRRIRESHKRFSSLIMFCKDDIRGLQHYNWPLSPFLVVAVFPVCGAAVESGESRGRTWRDLPRPGHRRQAW